MWWVVLIDFQILNQICIPGIPWLRRITIFTYCLILFASALWRFLSLYLWENLAFGYLFCTVFGVIQMSHRWPLCIGPVGCLFLHCRLRPISSKADLHQTQSFTHPISSYLKNGPSKQILGHLGLLCFAYPMKPNLASAGLW